LYHFEDLSPRQFSRLCFWIVDNLQEFSDAEYYDLTGDKNRDVIAKRYNKNSKQNEKCYFQCKRYKKIDYNVLKKELDGINHHSCQNPSFKPERIYFVLACELSPSIKDDVKKYGKTIGFHTILFWARTELDKKVKDTKAYQEFFSQDDSHVGVNSFLKRESESIKTEIRSLARSLSESEVPLKDEKHQVDKELKSAKKLINDNQFDKAIEKVISYLGILLRNPEKYKTQLSIAYHYLGICYNRLPEDGGDIDKAEEYVKLSIKNNSRNKKAICTLAFINIRRGKKENFDEAYKITSRIWNTSKKKEPYLLDVHLWATAFSKSTQSAIEFFEESSEAQKIVSKSDVSSGIVGKLYAELKNYPKSLEFVDQSLKINPQSATSLHLKGSILIAESITEDATISNFEIVPRLKSYKKIQSALELLTSALPLFVKQPNSFYEQLTKLEIYFCSLLLGKYFDNFYLKIRNEINESLLPDHEKKKLQFLDFVRDFDSRQFTSAVDKLMQFVDWDKMDYVTKIKFAQIFLRHGAPEQAKKILLTIETTATKDKNIRFWVEMSFIEALLGNKSRFLNSLKKVKQLSTGSKFEESALLHQITLTQRYNSEETDRFVETLLEHDSKFPNKKISKSIKVLDENKQPTQEILDIFAKMRESYEKFKDHYNNSNVPVYILEEYLRRPYSQIVATNTDTTLWTKYYAPIISFDFEMREHLQNADCIVFDYSSLLNLAKMGLLEELERLNKKMFITLSLFTKIQYELVLFENEDLRRLWNFLRESNQIEILDFEAQKLKTDRIAELLETWIIDSFELSIEKNAVLISDDLSFIRLMSEYKIKGSITLAFLRWLLENDFIDQKIYGSAIGDLAERFYIVIPFDSLDLLNIVTEDECKIKLRSYHLVNHITIPGILRSVYSMEFRTFINKLWMLGILPEDKNNWLQFITRKLLEAINLCEQSNDSINALLITIDLKHLWYDIVNLSSQDDFKIVKREFPKLFSGEKFPKIKEYIENLMIAKNASD
jgi:tetratricopeptide (TPR) repeat protein